MKGLPPPDGFHALSAQLVRNIRHLPTGKIAKATGQWIAFTTMVCLGVWIMAVVEWPAPWAAGGFYEPGLNRPVPESSSRQARRLHCIFR